MNAAKRMIQKNGIDSFSFRTLAEIVNIKSSSVHYHFPKKDDLLVAIAIEYNNSFFKILDRLKQDNLSSREKLLKLIELFEDTKKKDLLCLCGMLAANNNNLTEQSQKEVNNFFLRVTEWINDILDIAKKNNELNSRLKTKSLSNILISSFEGALLIDRVDKKFKYLKSCKDLVNDVLG